MFCGRIEISLSCDSFEITIYNLPVSDAVEYSALQGSHCNIADCRALSCNQLPRVCISSDSYEIAALKVDAIPIDSTKQQATITTQLSAHWIESRDLVDQREREIQFSVVADCIPFCRRSLIHSQQPIEIRFANHYLPLLGESVLPKNATRQQVVELFGEPEASGGGKHPQFGLIPQWIRYSKPDYQLRFAFDEQGLATDLVVMPFGPLL